MGELPDEGSSENYHEDYGAGCRCGYVWGTRIRPGVSTARDGQSTECATGSAERYNCRPLKGTAAARADGKPAVAEYFSQHAGELHGDDAGDAGSATETAAANARAIGSCNCRRSSRGRRRCI